MELVIAAILAGIGGVSALVWSWQDADRRTRRVLRRARVVPIAELVDGQLACIVGTVEASGETLTAMMSGTTCVAFDTTTSAFQSELIVDITTTRHAVPFYVVDGTGRARIDAPQIALCHPPTSRTDRFAERVLVPGARVRIVGSVSLDPMRQTTAEHAYREGTFAATLSGTAKFPMLANVEGR